MADGLVSITSSITRLRSLRTGPSGYEIDQYEAIIRELEGRLLNFIRGIPVLVPASMIVQDFPGLR